MGWMRQMSGERSLQEGGQSRAGALGRLGIAFGTVLFLAWAAANTLATVKRVNADGSEGVVIDVHPQGPEGREPTGGRLWLERLIVDGRLLRSEKVEPRDSWSVVPDRQGSDLAHRLLYESDSDPSRLAVPGRHVVVFLRADRWTGTIRLSRNGEGEAQAEQVGGEETERLLVMEYPKSSASPRAFLGVLLFGAVCAWWFGPVRPARSHLLWLTFMLTIVHGLFWVSQCVGTNNDSPEYMEAIPLFFVEGKPSYFPPGYPLLLGFLQALAGEQLGRWISLVQHGLVIVAVSWLYLLGRRIVSDELALCGGVLAGIVPTSLTTAQAVMSESPTLFAMVGALYFAVRSAETGRTRDALISGLLMGWAGVLRVVPLVALFPAIVATYFMGAVERRVRRAAVTWTAAGVVILVPILWCGVLSGQPTLAVSQGFHLFNRVVMEQGLWDAQGRSTQRLLALREGEELLGKTWWDVRYDGGVQDLNDEDAERLFREVSFEGIRKDPWGYLTYTPDLAWRMYLARPDWIPAWGDTIDVEPPLESPAPMTVTATSLGWRQGLERFQQQVWPMVCWMAVVGFCVGLWSRQRLLVLALAWIPAGYLLGSASVEFFSKRYNSAVAPFVVLLALLPFGLVWRKAGVLVQNPSASRDEGVGPVPFVASEESVSPRTANG